MKSREPVNNKQTKENDENVAMAYMALRLSWLGGREGRNKRCIHRKLGIG